MMGKPRIIVQSKDDDETFCWASDGWHDVKSYGDPKSDALYRKAQAAVKAAKNVVDAIRLLREAGFTVVRKGEE